MCVDHRQIIQIIILGFNISHAIVGKQNVCADHIEYFFKNNEVENGKRQHCFSATWDMSVKQSDHSVSLSLHVCVCVVIPAGGVWTTPSHVNKYFKI